VSERVMMKSLS